MISRAALLLVVVPGAIYAQSPTPPAAAPPPLPQIYLAFQVERPVAVSPKNTPPRYTMELRKANIEGEVLVKFVVDSTGQAILSTFSVIRSSQPLFTDAVKDALPALRFTPASIKGRKVAQLVQMPFVFSLAPRDTGSTQSSSAVLSRRARRVAQMMAIQAATRTTIDRTNPVEPEPPDVDFT